MTTKGHFGCRTIYRSTLDHFNRQIPLSLFNLRYAHIKITPGEEAIADIMRSDLESRGFIVGSETAPWTRGHSHFTEYLKDQIKVSKDPRIYDSQYVMFMDDDYPILCHRDPLLKVINRMKDMIGSDPDMLTIRFPREGESQDHLRIEDDPSKDILWSKDVNWQPMVLRSRDFHRLCKTIEDNWTTAVQMHGEALWREVLAPMSRSIHKHAVWFPSYAEVANLGVSNYLQVSERLGLTIFPNP